MKTKLKLLKAVMIVLTMFIIISLSTPNAVTPARAESLGSKASVPAFKSSGPHGPEGQPLEDVAEMVMPPVDTEKLLQEAQQRSWDQPPRFATTIDVQVNPFTAGTWETLENGLELWRLRIASADAVSLNMGFTRYHMPPGGELYLYSPDYSVVMGPFTEKDNAEHGQLWTPIVEGAEVVLEVSLPASAKSELQLELTAVNHGFIDFDTAEKSGSCNRDVICPEGNAWRSQIRSVGRYIFNGNALCSGALINNTANNLKPYFLTANHCLSTSAAAATVVVYWNYDCPTCRALNSQENATPISTSGFPTQTGAFLRATYAPSDMTLLELDSPVASNVNAYWSGWDRRGLNAASAVTIHHPAGHEKRISFENQPTTVTSYGGTTIPGDGTHIRITDWDLGTTEGGSSGSPLFDQNLRIIGQLHGGAAACGNNSSDWYGRLYTSWTGGGTNASRLSNWLDPGNSGAQFINGVTQPVVPVDSYEPDNTSAQAKTIALETTQTHSIRPAGDVDWVKFTLTAPAAVVLQTSGPAGGDTEITLYDSNLAELDYNDDRDPTTYYSSINTCWTNNLPAGTYYTRVNEYLGDNEISSYKLSLHGGNNCIFTNLGDTEVGNYPLFPGASARQSFVGKNNGPVMIYNWDDNPFVAAERVIFKANGVNTSYSEMMGLSNSQLSNEYWLPWYNNVDLDTQLRIGNVSNSTAHVSVYINGQLMTGSPFTLAIGASSRLSFAGVNNGPVRISSDVDIVAAERVIYTINGIRTSFSEVMAIPTSQLSTTYWIPWYDNVNQDTQLRFANITGSTAHVNVYIGGQLMPASPFTIPANGSTRVSFAGVTDGPVKIDSDVNIVAAERVIYTVNGTRTSYSEMMALPNGLLNTTHWLPWYNNVDLSTELRIGNPTNGQVNVQILIGGVQPTGGSFSVPANGSVLKTFTGINNGVVKVIGGGNIVVSERVIYKVNNVNTSYSEMMALPNSLLDTLYWFPWYNNVDLDTQMRFGLP